MSCPRCGLALVQPVPLCPACGFHVGEVQRLLGANSVRIERLVDHAACLSLRDTHYLNLALDEFERRFPQTFVSVFLGSLPAHVNAPQAAFWLLNHGAAIRQEQCKPGHWGIALVLDLVQKQAGLSVGYSVEALIEPPASMLSRALPHFAHGEYARGVHSVLSDLECQLMRKGSSKRRAHSESLSDQSHLGLEQIPSPRERTELPATRR